MIQILILIVLLVIAIVLAPWLIGLAALAAAAYGVYAVILGAILALAIIAGATWGLVSSMRNTEKKAAPVTGNRVVCKSCQAEVSENLTHCDNCHERL